MSISDWSSDVCSSDLLSAGTRDRDVETLRRKYEISLGQGEFGIGDALGQYDCVAFLALNPVDGLYEGTATQSHGQGIADGGALSSVGTGDGQTLGPGNSSQGVSGPSPDHEVGQEIRKSGGYSNTQQ